MPVRVYAGGDKFQVLQVNINETELNTLPVRLYWCVHGPSTSDYVLLTNLSSASPDAT